MHRRKIDRDPAVYTSKAKASATAYRLPIALTDSGCSGEEAGAGGESSFQSPTGSSRASNAREDAKAKDPQRAAQRDRSVASRGSRDARIVANATSPPIPEEALATPFDLTRSIPRASESMRGRRSAIGPSPTSD